MKGEEDDGLVTHHHTETPEEVKAYWENLEDEPKPVPMPRVIAPKPHDSSMKPSLPSE